MITPVSSLPTRLIHISTSYWIIFRLLEINYILEWKLSIGMEFKSNVLCKFIEGIKATTN